MDSDWSTSFPSLRWASLGPYMAMTSTAIDKQTVQFFNMYMTTILVQIHMCKGSTVPSQDTVVENKQLSSPSMFFNI